MTAAYSASTNRRVGECTDANGNLDGACGYNAKIYDYDASNRLIRYGTPNATEPTEYAYSPSNQRVWKRTWDDQQQQWDEELTFYGGNGQKLVSYTIYTDPGNIITAPSLNANNPETYIYFGGKLIKNGSGYVTPDRLGSVGKFFPYGQERPSATANDTDKFATYYRDDESGLDYANNRYHAPGQGRFNTPDPYIGSARLNNPSSFNRYAYAGSDPVNHNDPSGLDFCDYEIWSEGCPDNGYYDPETNPYCYEYGIYDPHCKESYNPVGGMAQQGGGTVGLGTPYQQAIGHLDFAGQALSGRTNFSATCTNGIAKLGSGATAQGAAASASNLRISDGTASNLQISQAPGPKAISNLRSQLQTQYQNLTVSQLFLADPGMSAFTAFDGTMFINAANVGTNPIRNQALLMHEALHQAFGLVDESILDSLYGLGQGQIRPTADITEWIYNNCI